MVAITLLSVQMRLWPYLTGNRYSSQVNHCFFHLYHSARIITKWFCPGPAMHYMSRVMRWESFLYLRAFIIGKGSQMSYFPGKLKPRSYKMSTPVGAFVRAIDRLNRIVWVLRIDLHYHLWYWGLVFHATHLSRSWLDLVRIGGYIFPSPLEFQQDCWA